MLSLLVELLSCAEVLGGLKWDQGWSRGLSCGMCWPWTGLWGGCWAGLLLQLPGSFLPAGEVALAAPQPARHLQGWGMS